MTDILDKLPDEELTKEDHEALLLRSEHAITPSLSPAALAVLNAALDLSNLSPTVPITIAVLRMIAAQLQMDEPYGDTDADAGVFAAHQAIRSNILAIADELENI